MKKNKILTILSFTTLTLCGLAACESDGEEQLAEFSFTVGLESNKSALELGDEDRIVVSTNGVDAENRNYEFTINGSSTAISLGTPNGLYCPISADAIGTAAIVVKETRSEMQRPLKITVTDNYGNANGGFNYASLSGEEAISTRTKILGKLEKYAVESHLTGITLFENGGYIKFSSRLEIPTEEYITGYGFGTLAEGDIIDDLPGENNADYKRYYHSAQSSNPGKINAMDDTGSQVSDLSDYITRGYWGNKMNATKNGYDWYPVLAKDTVNGKPNNRPIPVYDKENPLNLYKRWRIYVKTGADGAKYRTNGRFKSQWDNRDVQIEDYEFTLKMLLTGANGLFRGGEMASDKTYGIKGAQTFYNKTKGTNVDQATIDDTWNDMRDKGELGFSYNKDESYIEIELVNEIDDFTAMHQLSSKLYSPLPQEFVQMLGNGEVKTGCKIYGEGKDNYVLSGEKINLTPNDTTLSLGAYYLEHWEDDYIAFKQNDTWFERKT